MTIEGYLRPHGAVGVRNHLLVLPTVACSCHVAGKIADGVPGAVAISHQHGCAQIGEDADATFRTLTGTGANPNVGAVLVVGLGCEQHAAQAFAEAIRPTGKPVEWLDIQAEGGTSKAIARGRELARRLAEAIAPQRRVPCPFGRLVIGMECGGSDSFSGLTGNPLVGEIADRAVAAGATVMVSETTEFIGAEHLLVQRGLTPELGEQARKMVLDWEKLCRFYGADLTGSNPSPGNIEGGITTIEEKSLGCVHKGGTSPIQEVLDYAQRPTERGLVLMDTPGNDVESVAGMVAGGCTIVLFTTGRGTPLGCAVAPVIKIATNTPLAERMAENMDFNAGLIADGSETISESADRLWALMLHVASGRQTCAELLGHREFGIRRMAPTL
ncbi:MAG: altronate dehydratase [Planctomycetes bacterium]|nr:altronate dehydratase [Planctomycetota bacterium]